MRRLRTLFVLFLAVAGLVLPTSQATAQVSDEELVGVITGTTNVGNPPPVTGPPVTHCGSFDNVAIAVTATRVDGTNVRNVSGQVVQAAGHSVGFCTTETLLQGDGELDATTAARGFRNRTGVEIESNGDVSDACIELDIADGRFTRVGTVAVADIRIRVQTARVDAGTDCHTFNGPWDFDEHVCGTAVVTATPNPANPAQAIVAGTATARRC